MELDLLRFKYSFLESDSDFSKSFSLNPKAPRKLRWLLGHEIALMGRE